MGGIEDLQATGWLLTALGVGIVGVFLAGYLVRRLPIQRARWAVASLGLLAFVTVLPDCATVLEDGRIAGAECSAVSGTITFLPRTTDATDTVQSLALGVTLAVGVAPLLVPVLRQRRERDGQ
jgi:predicted MFS family arabinose efflux permease